VLAYPVSVPGRSEDQVSADAAAEVGTVGTAYVAVAVNELVVECAGVAVNGLEAECEAVGYHHSPLVHWAVVHSHSLATEAETEEVVQSEVADWVKGVVDTRSYCDAHVQAAAHGGSRSAVDRKVGSHSEEDPFRVHQDRSVDDVVHNHSSRVDQECLEVLLEWVVAAVCPKPQIAPRLIAVSLASMMLPWHPTAVGTALEVKAPSARNAPLLVAAWDRASA